MSTPNLKVIMALMESYLNFRQTDWGMTLNESGVITLPSKEWNLNKAKTCFRIMERLKDLAKKKSITTKDSVDLCQFLLEEENKELELFNKYPWPINRNHSLLDLIRAIRSYVISAIKSETAQINIEDIKTAASALTTENNIDYLSEFFEKHVKVNDPKYIELKETDFASFVKSVEETDKSKKRTRTLCEALYKALDVPAPQAQAVVLQSPASTPPAPGIDKPEAKKSGEVKTVETTTADNDAAIKSKSALQANSTFASKTITPDAPRKQSSNRRGARRRLQVEEAAKPPTSTNSSTGPRASIRK